MIIIVVGIVALLRSAIQDTGVALCRTQSGATREGQAQ